MAVNIGDYSISLDTKDPNANVNFVSHAHSDHTGGVRKNSKVLCSEITRDLMKARMRYDTEMVEPPKNARLLNSGHMFGSKQLYFETELGCRIVYTGDYQMQNSPAAESIEIKDADILIMDSTYPYPNVVFDEKEEVISNIQHYIKSKKEIGSVIFGAYSMGKAQELIRICNEIGVTPLVDHSISKINEVYSKHGMRLDYATRDIGSKIDEECFGHSVWISSMHRMNHVRSAVAEMNIQMFSAVATGFAKMMKFNTDVQFALSDHADFKQAVEYIDACNPKCIYTCGSSGEAFAKNLSAKGYKASSLKLTANITSLLMNYV